MAGSPIRPSEFGASPQTRYATFTSRFRAVLIDTALVFGALITVLLLGDIADGVPGSGRLVWILMVALLFLYEPLLIWRRGATIGHSARQLQVVSIDTGERPGFLRALVRYLIKVILGLPSFVTMTFSRRHQAVHDILTRTTVQLAASADPDMAEYHLERVVHDDLELPSPLRRLVAIAVYLASVFVVYGIALVAIDRDHCAQAQACTGPLRATVEGLALLWLCLSVGVVIAGWKGLLFGARRVTPVKPDSLVA
jgi:uncharacterized RDD family membrane protein YckC